MMAVWLKGMLAARWRRLLIVALGVVAATALVGVIGAFAISSASTMTARAVHAVPVDWQAALTPGADASALTSKLRQAAPMPFAGYLVSIGRFELLTAATVGALGCNVGSTAAYYVAVWGGRRAVERWGRYVLLRPGELDNAERFFARYGAATVFLGRLLPVVRTYIAFPAGLARMPMGRFQLYTFLGSWPWCFGLAYVGKMLGARWNRDPTSRRLFHEFDAMIVVALVLAVVWFFWARLRAASRAEG